MKKEKSMKIFISKDLSSDEEDNIEKYKEYQCRPKIKKEDFKDYIHVSDDESSQKRITPKKEKVKRKKDSNPIQKNNIKGTSETIARILQPYNIRVAHKPITTFRQLLTNVKDKDEPNDRQGAVYKIKCCDRQATLYW